MSNKAQRAKAIKDLSFYFAEKGKVMTTHEYIDAKDKPIRFADLRRIFRSYSKLMEMLERDQPDLFKLAVKKEQPKPAPTPAAVEPKEPKPEASVKPAVKPAVKVDKDDE
jgi:hypothetical protein